MNDAKLLFLPIIFSFLSVSAESVRLLQQAEINKKIVMIESKIIRDKRILFGLTALGHAQNIYVLWSFVSPWFVDRVPVKALAPLCEGCKALATASSKQVPCEKVPFLTAVWSGLANFGYNTKNLFTTGQGWLTIGQCGLYYGSILSAPFVARMAGDLIHPDTLRWYMKTYVPYELTIQDMKEAIINLQNQSIMAEQVDYNVQILKDSRDRLARYGESICAYMAYKTKWLEDDERPIAERAACYFFKYYNNWLNTIADQCGMNNPDYQQIHTLIIGYETEILAQLRHFYAIEGETKTDRRAIREKS